MILNNIFRSYLKKGKNNIFKILALGVGLAMGLVLIAKVYFEQSYDDFYPDKERIYQVRVSYVTPDKNWDDIDHISGGVVVGMKEMIPDVELSTRYTGMNFGGVFYTVDRKKISSYPVLADSCLFDMFPTRILVGDPHEVLTRPMYAMVARSVAENMGGVDKAVGQTFTFDQAPGLTLTVGGVFEDLPKNSHLSYTMTISLNSIGNFMGDGSMNWLGNERYSSYVKVRPGADPKTFDPQVQLMKEKYLPLDYLKEVGMSIDYSFFQLKEVYANSPETRRTVLLLSLLAFALLFTAVMNYVLIVISSLVNRSREMAVYKCYGASAGNIRNRMLLETLVDLLISIVIAGLLVLAFRGVIADLLNTDVSVLFSSHSSVLLLAVCLGVFLLSGLIPGYLFSRVPVAVAFRRFTETRRFWKLGFLFVQFVAAAFFTTLLLFIVKQYNFMVNDDPGYSYENVVYCELSGVDAEMRQKIVDEVGRMAEVKEVTTTSALPIQGYGGNNIGLPGDDRELFNIADRGQVGDGFFRFMDVKVIDGSSFREGAGAPTDQLMVSRSFVDKILQYTGWTDGVIGKTVTVTGQSGNSFTICGVYEDYRVGSAASPNTSPTVTFYRHTPRPIILAKFHTYTPEAMQKMADLVTRLLPDKDVHVYSLAGEMVKLYSGSRQFRDQVMLGGLVTLLICLIGLIGYTNDEMSRRRKEVAIRKVNGATIANIERLFLTDISRMAIPAVILGGLLGYLSLLEWMKGFAEKVSLSPIWFAVCGITVWLIILAAVSINCYRAATDNPADSVKSE